MKNMFERKREREGCSLKILYASNLLLEIETTLGHVTFSEVSYNLRPVILLLEYNSNNC